MDCAEYKRWFSPYIDERLEPQERSQLEQHLGKCAGCRSDLASLQEMLRSLRAMEPPEVPELLPGIHAKLAREPWWQRFARRFVAPWPASLPLHGAVLATTALLVIVVVGLPHFARAPRASLRQLASKPSDEIGERFARRGYEPYHNEKTAAFDRMASPASNEPQLGFLAGSSTVHNAGLTMSESSHPDLEQAALRPLPEAPTIPEKTMVAGSVSSAVNALTVQPADATSVPVGLPAYQAVGGFGVVGGAPAGTATTCPPCEKKRAELASQWEEHSHVQWRVSDLATAAAQLNGWAQSKGGSVATIDEHRLSVTLPEAAMSEFLTQFSSDVSAPATISLDAPPDSTRWVTISLELVPSPSP